MGLKTVMNLDLIALAISESMSLTYCAKALSPLNNTFICGLLGISSIESIVSTGTALTIYSNIYDVNPSDSVKADNNQTLNNNL